MPTYELKCRSCGEVGEKFLTRLLRDEDRVCGACGSRDVKPGVGGGVLGSGTRVAPGASSAVESCGTSGFS